MATGLLSLRDAQPARVDHGEGRLFLGSVGAALNGQALDACGITHVLALGADLPRAARGQVLALDLKDSPKADLRQHLPRALRFIDEALRQDGARVLVHCFQGKSRSVAVVAAWLMREEGCGLEEALEIIRRTRPRAAPNLGFAAQLRAMARTGV